MAVRIVWRRTSGTVRVSGLEASGAKFAPIQSGKNGDAKVWLFAVCYAGNGTPLDRWIAVDQNPRDISDFDVIGGARGDTAYGYFLRLT